MHGLLHATNQVECERWYNIGSMQVRAIIFDLYGVLGLNGWQDFKQRHFDGRWELWEPLRLLGHKVDAGEATDGEFTTAIAAATGETAATVRYQFEHTQANIELLEFVKEQLHGKYKIGLLSNASSDVLPGIFTAEQQELFDCSMMSVFVGLAKPDPTMFTLICEQLGVQPSECIMIDDQQRHLDIAATLGMKTVLYSSTEQAKQDITRLLQA